jgi:hypothetical protein
LSLQHNVGSDLAFCGGNRIPEPTDLLRFIVAARLVPVLTD